MRIFYAVQATGNGHIARAMELMPYLKQYGQVDVFLSGSNSHLDSVNMLPVKYRSKGVSLFYTNKGGLDYWKMLKKISPLQVYNEAKQLPVEKYDIVINDFECITSLACKLKNIPSISFGHQASFLSNKVPRPHKKSTMGELILKKYASAQSYIGLHFKSYDNFIFSPVIKEQVLDAGINNKGHITVYLPHYSDLVIAKKLKQAKNIQFDVFSKRVKQKEINKNITFIPVNNTAFTESMINAHAVITGAGFETPAEALYLGKKLMCLPIKGQYEQLCNAAALKEFNVPVVNDINDVSAKNILSWLDGCSPGKLELTSSTASIVDRVILSALSLRQQYHVQPLNPLWHTV